MGLYKKYGLHANILVHTPPKPKQIDTKHWGLYKNTCAKPTFDVQTPLINMEGLLILSSRQGLGSLPAPAKQYIDGLGGAGV